MSPSTQLSRRLRWAVPAGAVAVVGGILAASLVSAAQAIPALPSRTPAQLLAAVAGRTGPPPAMTGTVVETAALGLPDLPNVGDSTSLQSLLTGSHTIRVWYADPQHLRLAIPGQLSETDLIRSGQDVWLWSSVQNKVTHLKLAADSGSARAATGAAPAREPVTPQQAAQQVLAAVGPTTAVSVASNVSVAGEASYELVLAPKDARSLIGQVRIAIDAAHNVPLRVQVIPRGSASAAFQTGFTSIAFTRPAPANFAFTPPPGASVVQGGQSALPAWASVFGLTPPPGAMVFRGSLPAGARVARCLPAGQAGGPARKEAIHRMLAGGVAVAKVPGAAVVCLPAGQVPAAARRVAVANGATVAGSAVAGAAAAKAAATGADTTVTGQGWLTVAVLHTPVGGLAGGNPAVGPDLFALSRAATPVSGAWGSGRLLRTKLVSVLLTSDGRMLIGAVTPSVLYSAAAQTSGHAGQAGK